MLYILYSIYSFCTANSGKIATLEQMLHLGGLNNPVTVDKIPPPLMSSWYLLRVLTEAGCMWLHFLEHVLGGIVTV